MPLFDTIPSTYEDAIIALARWHGESFDHDVKIFSVPDPDRQQIRLIEVSDSFPTPGPALPIPLGRSADFPFRSSVALATEADWQQIKNGVIEYPYSWDIQQARQVWPQ